METREQWSNRAGFLFAAIGSAIGLGNIWRYPYIAYENGGGAFLIPYFIALLTAGIPILLLEYSRSQVSGLCTAGFQKNLEKMGMAWLVAVLCRIYYRQLLCGHYRLVFKLHLLLHRNPVGR